MNTQPALPAANLLQVGHWFQFGENLYEITAWEAKNPLEVAAREADSQSLRTFTLLELFAPAAAVRFGPTKASLAAKPAQDETQEEVVDANSLPAHLLERADHLVQTVEAVQAEIARTRQDHQRAGEPFSFTEATGRPARNCPRRSH